MLFVQEYLASLGRGEAETEADKESADDAAPEHCDASGDEAVANESAEKTAESAETASSDTPEAEAAETGADTETFVALRLLRSRPCRSEAGSGPSQRSRTDDRPQSAAVTGNEGPA